MVWDGIASDGIASDGITSAGVASAGAAANSMITGNGRGGTSVGDDGRSASGASTAACSTSASVRVSQVSDRRPDKAAGQTGAIARAAAGRVDAPLPDVSGQLTLAAPAYRG